MNKRKTSEKIREGNSRDVTKERRQTPKEGKSKLK